MVEEISKQIEELLKQSISMKEGVRLVAEHSGGVQYSKLIIIIVKTTN
jgi:hypothetical protein